MDLSIVKLKARLYAAACGSAPPEPLLICGLVERFLDFAASYYPARLNGTSETDNFMDAIAPLTLLYADCLAKDFQATDLIICRQWLIEQDLARSTVNARVRRIRQVFRWAVTKGWLPETMMAGLETVKGLRRGRSAARETLPVLPVPAMHVSRTLPHLRPMVQIMVKLQLATASRPGEILSMRGDEIARSAEDVWMYHPRHKTEHAEAIRVIPLGPRAIELIHARLVPGFIFPSRSGGPYRITSYETAIRRAAMRAAVPHWSPNRLRHLKLTEADEVHGIETAQELASHTDIRTTERYLRRAGRRAIKFAKERG